MPLKTFRPWTNLAPMKPEEKARQKIDQLFEDAGWKVQDYRDLNLGASLGVGCLTGK